ncbi:MAG: hypothetical protein ACU836_17575 [Gammaproteobacteria bacterium]
MSYKPFFTVVLMTLAIGKAALAAEITEVAFDTLPDTVKTTVLSYVDKKGVSKTSKISDEGSIRFEIEADKVENDKSVVALNIVIAENGKIMKITHEVPYFALSYDLMQAVEKRFPGIKVTEAESVENHYFDVIGELNGQPLKFRLQENGMIEQLNLP